MAGRFAALAERHLTMQKGFKNGRRNRRSTKTIGHAPGGGFRERQVAGNENLTGKCHWCSEPTMGIVCSRECREDMNKADRRRYG